MTNKKEDITPIEYILILIDRQSWVDDEFLLLYEYCYRYMKRVAINMDIDTTSIDKKHEEVVRIYDR